MRVKFIYDIGISGIRDEEVVEIPDEDFSEKYLDDYAWHGALNFAESYGYYPYPEFYDEDEVGDEDAAEDGDQYSDNIEGYWKILTEEDDD